MMTLKLQNNLIVMLILCHKEEQSKQFRKRKMLKVEDTPLPTNRA